MTSAEAVDRFLGAIEQGLAGDAISQALQYTEEAGVTAAVVDLLAPVQRAVGSRWQLGRYTVTQEHQASAVVDDILGLLVAYLSQAPEPSDTVALVCAEGEWHTTPARMAALLVREAGWQVRFLGASTPADHLGRTLAEMCPQAVAISCTLPLALPGVASLAEVAHQLELPVLVGGRGFAGRPQRATALGADALADDPDLAVATLDRWLDRPPSASSPAFDPAVAQERGELGLRCAELVAAAYADLARRWPAMTSFDERRRRQTQDDLEYVLRFADVALLVDDATLFCEFVDWLGSHLAARGLPPAVVPVTLDAVCTALGSEFERTRALIRAAPARIG